MTNATLRIAVLAGLGLFPAACFPGSGATGMPAPLPAEVLGVVGLPTVKEPSGICYHTGRGTLFVVDDSGVVCEFTPGGAIVRQRRVRDDDFEGVTQDPATGLLYIAIEGKESILEVDPETLEPRREFAIPRISEGRTMMKAGGQGIEAIAFVPDPAHPHGGTFFVANQSFDLNKKPEDLSVVLEVEVPLRAATVVPGGTKIVGHFLPGVIDLSGLRYDAEADRLHAISDSTDSLLTFTRSGERLQSWRLPGADQEGIAVDADGILYIAQDSGGVLKLKPDWTALRPAR